MSSSLPIFETTVQESNEWLKMIQARLRPCDRQDAYAGLRAVLHTLRDRLPMDAVLGLSAQLPMLLRGMFMEGWRPVAGPSDIRDSQDFADEVGRHFPPAFPRRPDDTLDAVFSVMADRLDPGEVTKLAHYLPKPLRAFFPAHVV